MGRMRSHVVGMAFLGLAAMSATPAAAIDWHYGGRAGAALVGLRGEFAEQVDPDWRVTPTLGGFIEADLAPTLGVRLDVMYAEKGASFESRVVDENGVVLRSSETRVRLTYADLPILLRVALPGDGLVVPYAVAGPVFGFALDAVNDSEKFNDYDLSDDLEPLDVGVTGGVGVRIGAGFGRLDVEARYATGLSNVWDASNQLESIHQGFALTLAWSR